MLINDLTEMSDEKCCPVMIGNYKLNCLLYANDLLLLSETKNGLKQCIAQLVITEIVNDQFKENKNHGF